MGKLKQFKKRIGKHYRKKSQIEWKKKLSFLFSFCIFHLLTGIETQIFAATPTIVLTQDFSNFEPVVILKTVAAILMTVIALIGYIMIGKSLMEISTAIQQNDNAGLSSGLKGLAGGGFMAGVSTLMVLFGFVL